MDRTHRHPEEICRQLGEMGLMGVAVPTEYDGAGMEREEIQAIDVNPLIIRGSKPVVVDALVIIRGK